MKFTLLIADDEEHVREELRYMLEKRPEIDLVKACSDGDETLEAVVSLQPDIVFLDISMPGLNGIQLGRVLKTTGKSPYITYITAYENYAADAFKVGAKGYVLKPFSQEDIDEQISHACNYLQMLKNASLETAAESAQELSSGSSSGMPYVAVETNGKFVLMAQSDIVFAYANDRDIFLRVGLKEYSCGYSLTELERMLQPQDFFRCHRNFIVNINHIKEIHPWFHCTYQLLMDDNVTQVPVSRSNVKAFRNKFKI